MMFVIAFQSILSHRNMQAKIKSSRFATCFIEISQLRYA